LADIVLVGHSYGGMVVTGVADAVPDKIASLIYLDAFVPEDGQSLFGMLPPDRPHATAPGEEWLTAPLPVEVFGKVSQQVRDFMSRKGMSQPTACFSQSVNLTGGIDRISRKIYIYCNDPEPTAFTQFYEKLKSRSGWTVRTLPCTHFVQMDMPGELTALLEAAV
jgi:pimeloyl-ACP methyl ester carboxylesterase